MKKPVMIILFLTMVMNLFGFSAEEGDGVRRRITGIEQEVLGEWEFKVELGMTKGGRPCENFSALGQVGTFNFLSDGSFTLVENHYPDVIEKGLFEKTMPYTLRLYFENSDKYGEEVYLQFNNNDETTACWRIIRRWDSGGISNETSEIRGLSIAKVRELEELPFEKNEISQPFKKYLLGEWKYNIGGAGGCSGRLVLGQTGTFAFREDGSFTLRESHRPNVVEKGKFLIADIRIIRLFFENKPNEEVYLEFNDENENDIKWIILRRDDSNNILDTDSEDRCLTMVKVK